MRAFLSYTDKSVEIEMSIESWTAITIKLDKVPIFKPLGNLRASNGYDGRC